MKDGSAAAVGLIVGLLVGFFAVLGTITVMHKIALAADVAEWQDGEFAYRKCECKEQADAD